MLSHVVVAGGGIAGWATAASLCQLTSAHITVLTGLVPENVSSNDASVPHLSGPRFDPAQGLWTGGQSVLHELGVLGHLRKHGKYIHDAGYRAMDGSWLASPSPLTEGPGPSLLFTRESLLLQALKSCCADSNRVSEHHDELLAFEETRASGDAQLPLLRVQTAGGLQLNDIHLLVGADGKHSRVRMLLHPESKSDNLRYRGYEVWRGVLPAGALHDDTPAFQTWGPGLRFALVPLAQGHAWFAAQQKPKPSGDLGTRFVWDGSSRGTRERWHAMVARLGQWHAPIPAILQHHTDTEAQTAVEDAFAHPGSLPVASDYPRVVLVGDAACCMDPILAVGAGVALEQGWALAQECPFVLSDGDLLSMAERLHQQMARRTRTLRVVSNISQSVGQVPSTSWVQRRDRALHMLPERLKTAAFDMVVRVVSAP